MPTIVDSSPARRKRGVSRRTRKSLVTSASPCPRPTSPSTVTPSPVARHVVRLSGHANETVARPSLPVTMDGVQYAVSKKLLRIAGADFTAAIDFKASGAAARDRVAALTAYTSDVRPASTSPLLGRNHVPLPYTYPLAP